MQLDVIRVNQFGEDQVEKKLEFSVRYDNGKDYPFRAKGLYVSVTPIELVDYNGYTMCRAELYGDKSKSGFCFCAKRLDKARPKMQRELHTFVEHYAVYFRELFNKGMYQQIAEFVWEKF